MKSRVYGTERKAREVFIREKRPGPGSQMSQEELNLLKMKACIDELKQRGMSIEEIEKATGLRLR